jgi:hypothetical protein
MSTTIAQPLTGPMVWTGEDLRHSTDWIRPLTAAEVDELDAALRAVQRRGLPWPAMTRDDFAIPRLDRTLAEVSDALEHGRGLALLRGVPVDATPRTSCGSSTGASACTWAPRAIRTATAS